MGCLISRKNELVARTNSTTGCVDRSVVQPQGTVTSRDSRCQSIELVTSRWYQHIECDRVVHVGTNISRMIVSDMAHTSLPNMTRSTQTDGRMKYILFRCARLARVLGRE